jgi:hypothetical protein
MRWKGSYPPPGVCSLITVQPGETASAKEKRNAAKICTIDDEELEKVRKPEGSN